MKCFEDRSHAGRLLCQALKKYQEKSKTIVLGLPRGGVVVAYEVAKGLLLPLDIVCPRKIGAPFNPELAIGAITETGAGVFNEPLISNLNISKTYLRSEIEKEKKKSQDRLVMYRKNRHLRLLKDQTVILVDDGLATGFTMKAAIQMMQSEGAKKIIVAVPVAPLETYSEIEKLVDEIVCLMIPDIFEAVGQFYSHFEQTEDKEVMSLMDKFSHQPS